MALASQLRILRVLFCAGGIYSAYLTQGIISERLATDEFGGGRFAHMSALPWFQSLACFACGYAMLKAPGLGGGDTGVRGVPPVSAYWRAALTASVGPSLGFMSLRNINYVAQGVGCRVPVDTVSRAAEPEGPKSKSHTLGHLASAGGA
eukprot:evm.model.scf_1071EXC.3 EVM.evm.TU.scf_1071EXC.3   scf_1071EXC:11823-12459(-)